MRSNVTVIGVKGKGKTLNKIAEHLEDNLNLARHEILNKYVKDIEEYTRKLFRVGGKRGFEGDMANAVDSIVYKSGLKGKVFIENKAITGSPNTTNEVAKMLEEGVAPHYVKFKDNPKAKRWAEQKGLKNKYSMLVGGEDSNVKLGKSKQAYVRFVWIRANKTIKKNVERVLKKAVGLHYKS